MNSRVTVIVLAVLLTALATSEGRRRRSLGPEGHCSCIQTESKPIGLFIEKVELILPNPHCEETEVIATLKSKGEQVCLDPQVPWVKKLIQKILSIRNQTARRALPSSEPLVGKSI